MSKPMRSFRPGDIDGMTCSHDDSHLPLDEAIAHRQVEHPTCLSCQAEVLLARALMGFTEPLPHTDDS